MIFFNNTPYDEELYFMVRVNLKEPINISYVKLKDVGITSNLQKQLYYNKYLGVPYIHRDNLFVLTSWNTEIASAVKTEKGYVPYYAGTEINIFDQNDKDKNQEILTYEIIKAMYYNSNYNDNKTARYLIRGLAKYVSLGYFNKEDELINLEKEDGIKIVTKEDLEGDWEKQLYIVRWLRAKADLLPLEIITLSWEDLNKEIKKLNTSKIDIEYMEVRD